MSVGAKAHVMCLRYYSTMLVPESVGNLCLVGFSGASLVVYVAVVYITVQLVFGAVLTARL